MPCLRVRVRVAVSETNQKQTTSLHPRWIPRPRPRRLIPPRGPVPAGTLPAAPSLVAAPRRDVAMSVTVVGVVDISILGLKRGAAAAAAAHHDSPHGLGGADADPAAVAHRVEADAAADAVAPAHRRRALPVLAAGAVVGVALLDGGGGFVGPVDHRGLGSAGRRGRLILLEGDVERVGVLRAPCGAACRRRGRVFVKLLAGVVFHRAGYLASVFGYVGCHGSSVGLERVAATVAVNIVSYELLQEQRGEVYSLAKSVRSRQAHMACPAIALKLFLRVFGACKVV